MAKISSLKGLSKMANEGLIADPTTSSADAMEARDFVILDTLRSPMLFSGISNGMYQLPPLVVFIATLVAPT